AEDGAGTGIGEDEPQQDLQGGGLPGAVGPEESEDLASLDGEVQPLQGCVTLLAEQARRVGLGQATDVQRRPVRPARGRDQDREGYATSGGPGNRGPWRRPSRRGAPGSRRA